jgi:hypothetical protein
MFKQCFLTVACLFLGSTTFAADLIKRAEDSPRKLSDGTSFNRVERDEAGRVTRLFLDEMELSQEELAELGKLEQLRSVSLFRTNVKDADLKHLEPCRQLEGVNLTSTEVTDAAIDSLLQFKQLKSVCLGNLRVSPEAIARLKEQTSERGQRLTLGYSQRK